MTRFRLRRIFAVSAALVLTSAAAACGGSDGNEGSEPQASGSDICPTADTTGSVTISYSNPLPVFMPVLLADKVGAFADAGLDVSVEQIPTADARPLVAQGEIDGQLTSFTASNFNVASAGVEVKFVAPLDNQPEHPPGTPIPGFWGRKDVVGEAGNLDLTQLRGGTVVGPTGTTGASAWILQKALEPYGMTLSDVQTGEIMSGSDGLIALSNGAVDLAWLSAPTEVEAAKNPDLVPVAGYPPGVTGTVLLAGPSLLDQPQVLVRILQVMSDVTAEYLEGDYREDPETVALLAELMDVDESIVEESTPIGFQPDFSMDGVADYLLELQDFLQEEGDLDYEEPLSIDQVLDERFVEALATCDRP